MNQRINVRQAYRHTVRAMVHSLFTRGTFEVWAPDSAFFGKRKGTFNQLRQMLGFIDHIDQYNQENSRGLNVLPGSPVLPAGDRGRTANF